MAPASRLDQKLNLDGLGTLNLSQAAATRSANNSGTNSPIEAPAGSGLRYPLGNGQAGSGRAGAASPSKEYSSRLFPKRAREIQQEEGVAPPIWGPPPTGSGHSTPLRETIPESPGSDSFPDFDTAGAAAASGNSTLPSSTRRARAGTVPSRFPGVSGTNTSNSAFSRSNRGSPSPSPYGANTPTEQSALNAANSNTVLMSRLRSGTMPHRSGMLGGNPFGSSLFANSWLPGRERASTLQSVRSSDGPSSPRDLSTDNDVRTLDYLGLEDTPQSARANMDLLLAQGRPTGPTIAELAALNAYNSKSTANRFRSYSVNAKEKYADGEEDSIDNYEQLQALYSGQLTPTAEATAAQAAAIQEAVRQHNLEVQAFATFASSNRPRARTAGLLDSPSSRVLQRYLPTPSRLDSSISAADLQDVDGADFGALNAAMQTMQLNPTLPLDTAPDGSLETPTRSLWLGNIPSSTTNSSLLVIFSQFGAVETTRVLTHKGCGFVNFENVASAMTAKAQFNGKEIFPGCGPVRIGYAKEQSAANTPGGANGVLPSPSPDPFVSKARMEGVTTGGKSASQGSGNINADTAAAALVTPNLLEHREEIMGIVQKFGAAQDDQTRISADLETAMGYQDHQDDIPAIPEPSHDRVFDAPRLREVRKRIDNNSCSQAEVENIAMDMLPEIAELSSDYLGNTVVQKLFEHCSEDTKDAMLSEIAPHLAEIGVHKNGTWAAQKIIDVARTTSQMQSIVDALRPHGVNLFLDQYGNYVMQCCLRFQAPLNNFIFETMLARLWDVAQGRFGARAVRACLESHFATTDQKRLMAAAIALHSVQLATNSNGALLLTWLLDTCTFPRRRSVLAPRLVPHLVHLCTHKVAYLTVLKIINQKTEPEARDLILKALFFDEATLTDIVSDQTCGATFLFKVLTTPFLEDSLRPECLEKVRDVLVRVKAQPGQGYKRLMDEVGLSSRLTPAAAGTTGSGAGGADTRSSSKSRAMNGFANHHGQLPAMENGYGVAGAYLPPQQALNPASLQQQQGRSVSIDSSNAYDPFAAAGSLPPQFSHSPALSAAALSPISAAQQQQQQQQQYPQALLAQMQAQNSRPPPPPAFSYSTAGPAAASVAGGLDPFRSVAAAPTGFPNQHHHHPHGGNLHQHQHSLQGFAPAGFGYPAPHPHQQQPQGFPSAFQQQQQHPQQHQHQQQNLAAGLNGFGNFGIGLGGNAGFYTGGVGVPQMSAMQMQGLGGLGGGLPQGLPQGMPIGGMNAGVGGGGGGGGGHRRGRGSRGRNDV